ncbi:MAG TPA: hypothetical protein VLD63_02840 [Anaerolineales bacterium]|nr:hypothetical protein [Anaerolineales bacterium]
MARPFHHAYTYFIDNTYTEQYSNPDVNQHPNLNADPDFYAHAAESVSTSDNRRRAR